MLRDGLLNPTSHVANLKHLIPQTHQPHFEKVEYFTGAKFYWTVMAQREIYSFKYIRKGETSKICELSFHLNKLKQSNPK